MVDLRALESGNVWKYLGMHMVKNDKGQLGVHIKISDNLKQVYGNVHGGIIATAVDAAVATAVNESIGKDYGAATIELKVNYLRPVKDNDIYAYATLAKKGRQLMVGSVDVLDAHGKLVAIGIATYMIQPLAVK